MRILTIIVLVALVGCVGGWLFSQRDTSVVSPAAVAATNAPRPTESKASVPVKLTASKPVTSTAASGTVNFSRVDGSGENLELRVVDGIALWNPNDHRLRVLLTGEALSAAEQQQMLNYLRDERLADSGRQYGVLDLQFRPDATTLDRGGLVSASLTVAAAGGVVRDTADVQSSIQWTGGVRPSTDPGAAGARPQLQLTAAGSARSADASSWQQDWQLSLAVPVVQAPEP